MFPIKGTFIPGFVIHDEVRKVQQIGIPLN
jgi:hypothetical protein